MDQEKDGQTLQMRLRNAYILLSLDKHYNLVCFWYKRPAPYIPVKIVYKLAYAITKISK